MTNLSAGKIAKGAHRIAYRVYYEDTDAGGVVYYANYLKFAERARTEALRAIGIEQQALREKEGIVFVVRRGEIDFKKPARLDDELTIETTLQEMSKLRMTMRQRIEAGGKECAVVMVDIVCVNNSFAPTRMPEKIYSRIAKAFSRA